MSQFSTYYHRNGCGGPAFYYERAWAVTGTLTIPSRARLLDGTTPVYGEEIHCGTCHQHVVPLNPSYLEEE